MNVSVDEYVQAPAAAPRPVPRSALRWPAAAAAFVAAVAHVPVTGQHLSEVPYVGWLFIALTATCLVAAVGLLVVDHSAIWASGATACLAAVLAFVVSRGPGLPGMADDIGDWANELAVISVSAESLVVCLAVVELLRRRTTASRRWTMLIPIGALALVGATYVGGLVTT